MQDAKKETQFKLGEKERIKALVVEDDRSFRLMLQEALNDLEGFVVDKTFAPDAKTALQKFQEIKPDMVLLDIHLPDGKGLDLIRPMLALNPAVGIVMVTGSGLSSDVEKAKQNGAIGYILKPYTRKKVEDAFHVFQQYRTQYRSQSLHDHSAIESAKISPPPMHFFIGEEESTLSPREKALASWNILFADGFLTNLENAERRLRKLCKHLDVAASTEEFEQLAATNEYHCVLLDPTIPDGNGYQLVHTFKQRYRQQKVKPYIIALMPNRDELDKKKWLQAGMHDFLLKPCSFKEIEEKLYKFAQRYMEEQGDTYLK